MDNLGTLYRFELKKLANRKLVWIGLLLSLAACGFSVFAALIGTHYVDGKAYDTYYHMFQVDQAYSRSLSSRPIDQSLLEETMDGYRKIPAGVDRYLLTEEYQTYARPYSPIFNIIRNCLTIVELEDVLAWEPEEQTLYRTRMENLEESWQSEGLTDGEKAYWRQQEKSTGKPWIYSEFTGWSTLLEVLNTAGFVALLLISICMSNVFYEEHARRTDQLTLSTVYGRRQLFWAKILAGLTLSMGIGLAITLTVMALSLGYFGTDGCNAPLQLMLVNRSHHLTMLQACLISYAMLLCAAGIWGVLTMALSEALRNNLAAVAVAVGLILAGMLANPPLGPAAELIWDCFPQNFIAVWSIFTRRLVCLWGRCFPVYAIVPLAYLLFTAIIALLCRRFYNRYQVSGR